MSATLTAPKMELKTELALKISGEILESNLPAYAAEIKEFISSLPKSLDSDEDFANAKTNVKALQTVEAAVKLAEENTLSQAKEIYETLTELKSIGELGRNTRLDLSKLIKEEDQRKKDDILENAIGLISERSYNAEARILNAMKGKKTPSTLQAAAEKEALAINSEIKAIDELLSSYDESLRHGRAELLNKSPDAVAAEMERRKQAQEAAIREAKLKEEAAKLKAEADAKAKEEAAKLKAEADAKAKEEAAKLEAEKKAQEQPEAKPAPEPEKPTQNVWRPKVDPIPVKSERPAVMDQATEAKRFLEKVPAIFGQFKEARLALQYGDNFDAAEQFAIKVNEAFLELKKQLTL